MTDPKPTNTAADQTPSPPGPVFEASAPLTAVLAWPALPPVLHRALSRAVAPEMLASLSFGESVKGWRDPALRAWIVALLALDVGVGFGRGEGYNDSMIGLFAHDQLDAQVARFCIGGVYAGQALGASYAAEAPGAPASVCAAAFVYRDANGCLESDFVFLAGATRKPVVQVELAWVDGRPFDAEHIAHALGAIAAQVEPAHDAAARAVVRDALLECLAALGEPVAPPPTGDAR